MRHIKKPLKMTFYTIRYFKSESPGEPMVRILLLLNNFFLFFVSIFFLSIASLEIILEFDYIFEPICSHFTKKGFQSNKNLSKQPLLWKTNSCIAAKYIEIGTTLQNTHHSSFFLHKLGFLTLWKNQSFIQSQLPKGITYVGANASQGCLIKHPHLCKWYLYSESLCRVNYQKVSLM